MDGLCWLSCICLCRDMFKSGPKYLCCETCRDVSHISRHILHMSGNITKTSVLSWRHFRQFSEVRARQIYYSYVKKVLWDGCKMKGHGTVVGSSPPFSKLR